MIPGGLHVAAPRAAMQVQVLCVIVGDGVVATDR